MKIGVSLFAVAATASVLSSSAFAGSYEIVGPATYQTVSTSCPAHTTGPASPDDYKDSDPAVASGQPQTLTEKRSTANFAWKPVDGFDNSLPAAFKISHSYTGTVNASVIRSNEQASGDANTWITPPIPNKTYSSHATGLMMFQDTPPVNWTASNTDVDFSFQPAQWGTFPISAVIGAQSSVYATAIPGPYGGVVTVSSSAKITTTELKLIVSP